MNESDKERIRVIETHIISRNTLYPNESTTRHLEWLIERVRELEEQLAEVYKSSVYVSLGADDDSVTCCGYCTDEEDVENPTERLKRQLWEKEHEEEI